MKLVLIQNLMNLNISLFQVHVLKMSFLNRIKSAVVGNPVTKEYELGRHIASAGPGLLWKIYNGVKKSTRQVECTIIVVINEHAGV